MVCLFLVPPPPLLAAFSVHSTSRPFTSDSELRMPTIHGQTDTHSTIPNMAKLMIFRICALLFPHLRSALPKIHRVRKIDRLDQPIAPRHSQKRPEDACSLATLSNTGIPDLTQLRAKQQRIIHCSGASIIKIVKTCAHAAIRPITAIFTPHGRFILQPWSLR